MPCRRAGKLWCAFCRTRRKWSPKSRTPGRGSRRKLPIDCWKPLPRRAKRTARVWVCRFANGASTPSMASAGRLPLTTRERDGEPTEGTQVMIGGGQILEVKAAGAAPGTGVEVRQPFFHLPASRKFLRTEDTEAAHIQHYLTLAALA